MVALEAIVRRLAAIDSVNELQRIGVCSETRCGFLRVSKARCAARAHVSKAGCATRAGCQKPQHLHAEIKDLALGRPWVCPCTLSLLSVEVESVALLVCIFCPLRNLLVNINFHLLHFVLDQYELI